MCNSHHCPYPPYNSLNKHLLINKYMTTVFNLRQPKPKLSFVWDVNILLSYFEQQGDNNSLSDKLLTQKLLKLVSTIFFSNFYFSLNDSPSKTMKNIFYFI